MILWIDAQLPPALAHWLSDAFGVTACAARDLGLREAKDLAIFHAAREAGAVIMSEVVNFHGRWHQITHAGLNPLPIQRPIPLWLGGGTNVEPVIERVGRLADGWFPQFAPDATGRAALERMRTYAQAAGRPPEAVGVEGRTNMGSGLRVASSTPDTWAQQAEDWSAMGATHLSVNTMRANLHTPDAHIAAIRTFYDTVRS